MSKLRILIADRQRSARSALSMLLSTQPNLELAGEAADMAKLLEQITTNDLDLVVSDWDMLGQRIEWLLDLLQLFERPPAIVALSVRAENQTAAKAADLAGFTHQGESLERLLEKIREVSQAEITHRN